MLFIFRVDIGKMINLDMNLALETVQHLKNAVASYCNIPVDKQVLLISGGEALEPGERVCKYTAGSSDTNPIFLFSVLTLESNNPPLFTEVVQERDLQPEVESSFTLPDTHNTVAVRASLAQEYVKVSRDQVRLCESEINDQHLQHQGWAAALANLEDSVLALEKRKSSFEEAFGVYLSKREHYRKVIETFDDDIHILSKIPVLPVLLDRYESGSDNNKFTKEGGIGNGVYKDKSESSVNLLDWINQAGNSSLEQIADSCYRSLEQLDSDFLVNIQGKIGNCVEGANNQKMKEIRGLGDRLSGLEQLLIDANKKVAEQKDLAAAFLQNQARANGLKDASILPDLCASHKQQLLVMMRNHQHIVSIRKRCVKAKEELSMNLYTRLKWVMFIQRQMAETGQQLVLYYEELKRLSRRLEVMEQLHLAPSMYLATVVEVVRRKSFSDHYLKKSSILAGNFSAIYAEEVKTRQIFQEKLSKHFLSTMFKGMDDLPPAFATQEPEPFDQKLPALSLTDLELLRSQLPDQAESLSVPDKKTLSSLLTKSLTQNLTTEEDNALQNLHNLTNKISIEGEGLGSMSVMNRICYDAVTRKKSRLEALAASRERDLGSETDSDEENVSKVKTKLSRKMTRSLPSKADAKILPTKNGNADTVSSSSVDPSSSTGNTNSSAAPSSDGSLLKQNWQSQTQAEDKSKEIEKLQLLLDTAGEDKEKVEERITKILGITNTGLLTLRNELNDIRTQVDQERKDLVGMLTEMTGKLIGNLKELESLRETENQQGEVVEERNRRKSAEEELSNVKSKLETEVNKLEDCHREIEIYRYQLQDATHLLDSCKAEWAEEKLAAKQKLDELEAAFKEKLSCMESEHESKMISLKQSLVLEHELEFDNMKQQIQSGEISKVSELEAEMSRLELELSKKGGENGDLETKLQLLEATTEERIKEEKERIVSILEAGFSERQRVALSQLERSLVEAHSKELEETVERGKQEMCSRLEELRQKMIESSQINLERVLEKKEKEWTEKIKQKEADLQTAFNEERKMLEEEKQRELEENNDKVRKKSKMELENLRSRFKIMQSTVNLDRSPSMSESDLSFEDARIIAASSRRNRCYSTGEFIKGSRSEGHEPDPKLEEKLDRAGWEKEREQLRRELEAQRQEIREKEMLFQKEKQNWEESVEEIRRSEKLRSSAEKQVIFNEAIRKAVEEKDKKIETLEHQLTVVGERKPISDLETQLAEMARRNAQLESELKDAQQKLSNNMITSFAVESDDSLKQLQEENRQLRDQLSRSMTSLISTGKVSVTSADRGEIVLVVWSDQHNNYSIYHEGSILHFLHTESIELLGLSVERGIPRTRHITAEVVEKEYCLARKPENRFRVPLGTKFYRVKCKQVEKDPVIKLS